MNDKTIETNVAVMPAPGPSNRGRKASGSAESVTLDSDRELSRLPSAVNETGARLTDQELWKLYDQQPDVRTENALMELYFPLVRLVLNRLAMSSFESVDTDDLHSAGLVGLLQAVRHFNSAAGVPFESYARHRIRGAIFDEMRRTDWVPRSVHEKAKKVQAAVGRLEQRLGRAPTERELARAMNLTVSECRGLLKDIRPIQFIHLDSEVNLANDDTENLHELFTASEAEGTAEQVSRRELQQVIFERLKQMPKIQCQVLTLYYLEDLNLREIASALKLTESRICQIHSQAIGSIRAYMQRFENGMAGCATSQA